MTLSETGRHMNLLLKETKALALVDKPDPDDDLSFQSLDDDIRSI